MMKPVIDCALDATIKCLQDEMSTFVDSRNPKNLCNAHDHTLYTEESVKQTDTVKSFVSLYHIIRKKEKIWTARDRLAFL